MVNTECCWKENKPRCFCRCVHTHTSDLSNATIFTDVWESLLRNSSVYSLQNRSPQRWLELISWYIAFCITFNVLRWCVCVNLIIYNERQSSNSVSRSTSCCLAKSSTDRKSAIKSTKSLQKRSRSSLYSSIPDATRSIWFLDSRAST